MALGCGGAQLGWRISMEETQPENKTWQQANKKRKGCVFLNKKSSLCRIWGAYFCKTTWAPAMFSNVSKSSKMLYCGPS